MKIRYLLLSLSFLVSCKLKPAKQLASGIPLNVLTENTKHAKIKTSVKQKDSIEDNIANETEDFYVVVADTGKNYYQLKDKMEAIHRSLAIDIDTMGRHYNKTKHLIALPDDDSDEIYRGDYFPRRGSSNFMSLEYMSFYKPKSSEKTIALIAGIYENKSSADSALNILKPVEGNAFAIKSSIYMGCTH